MSTMSEPLQNKPMWISLAMNAALSLGIVLLLSTAEAPNSNPGTCTSAPAVAAAGDIAQAGKVRHSAPAEVEMPGNVMRKAAVSPEASIATVSYIRCRQS